MLTINSRNTIRNKITNKIYVEWKNAHDSPATNQKTHSDTYFKIPTRYMMLTLNATQSEVLSKINTTLKQTIWLLRMYMS